MAQHQSRNVFQGPTALIDYFNPDLQPHLPLVEIPDKLNPLRGDSVRIYAKMLTALPAQNVKMLPALNMLLNDSSAATKSIVEASSGSTVLSLGMVSRVLWGNEDVCAYVTNKKHPDQLRILRFFGLKVSLYGGLAQQEPDDVKGIMSRLRDKAKNDENIGYPGQYDNDNNWKAHERWTGPQIFEQLPEINVFCTTVGTGGCITGTGKFLKSRKQNVKVVGVCNVFGDPTPGPRHFPKFESCKFPWRETIDTFETVASIDSYEMSMRLSREGLICGPSSGEALGGLLQYLKKLKGAGKLQELANKTRGEISCVFICCDLPYQYMDGYFQKLADEKFPPVLNKILLQCDQDKYDERWELRPEQIPEIISTINKIFLRNCRGQSCRKRTSCKLYDPSKSTLLDLRQLADFAKDHIRGSISSPLAGLTSRNEDIFGNAEAVHAHWTNLTMKFDKESQSLGSKKASIVVICYDGDASRLATSILRGRGWTAFSVLGGYSSVRAYFKQQKEKVVNM